MSSPTPYKFGRYEVLNKIGQGGMAIVYRVKDTIDNKVVALKTLLPLFNNNPGIVSMFLQEAETMAKLDHPYIVKIFERAKFGQYYYFTMEYVEGVTLKELIKHSRLSITEIYIIFEELCEALRYLHSIGILHQDIKSNNILLTKGGTIKITDFGIVKVEGRENIVKEQKVGTLRYMSPEHIIGKETDIRSDIYSLGVVLYEILTGRLPYNGGKSEIIDAKLKDKPVYPAEINSHAPKKLCNIVMKMMENDPDDRYASAEELMEELKKTKTDDSTGSISSESEIVHGYQEDDNTFEKKIREFEHDKKKYINDVTHPKYAADEKINSKKRIYSKKISKRKFGKRLFQLFILLIIVFVFFIIFPRKYPLKSGKKFLYSSKIFLFKGISKEITGKHLLGLIDDLIVDNYPLLAKELIIDSLNGHEEIRVSLLERLMSIDIELENEEDITRAFNLLIKVNKAGRPKYMLELALFYIKKKEYVIAETYFQNIIREYKGTEWERIAREEFERMKKNK